MRKWGRLGRSGTTPRRDDGSSDDKGMQGILINSGVSRGPSLTAAVSGASDRRKDREGPRRNMCLALYHCAPWCQEKCVACRNPSVTGGPIELRGFSLPYRSLMPTVSGTLALQRWLPD